MTGFAEFRMNVNGSAEAWSMGARDKALREITHYGLMYRDEGEITFEEKIKGRWRACQIKFPKRDT